MWLNSTLVFSGVFGVFGDVSMGGVGGWVFLGIFLDRVFLWDFRVDVGECRRSRAPIQVLTNDRESVRLSFSSSLSLFLPPSLSLSFLLSFSPRRSNDFDRNRIRLGGGGRGGFDRARSRESTIVRNDRPTTTLGGFLTGKWERP